MKLLQLGLILVFSVGALIQLSFTLKAEGAGNYPQAIYEFLWMCFFMHAIKRQISREET